MSSSEAPIITIALVLYEREAAESEAFASLFAVADSHPALMQRFRFVIFDNSSVSHAEPRAPIPLTFIPDDSNPGLAGPYNKALDLAEGFGSNWLLLLDQDTQLTPVFFTELYETIVAAPSSVVAIVPKLLGPERLHSPTPLPWINPRPLDPSVTGIVGRKVMACNSGASLRVSAVRAIGGFPREFWLDYLDHAVFHLLQRAGGRVHVLKAVLRHDLSIMDLNNKGSHGRFANALAAERLYYRRYGSPIQKMLFVLRLLRVSVDLALSVRDKTYARMCLRSALLFSDTRNQ